MELLLKKVQIQVEERSWTGCSSDVQELSELRGFPEAREKDEAARHTKEAGHIEN